MNNNTIITKEYFNEIMGNIEKTYRYQEGLNNYFYKSGVDGYIFQPDCIDTTLKLLHNIFKDENEWISYFCFEIDFGTKYKDGDVKDEDGAIIKLSTYDDLYRILTE